MKINRPTFSFLQLAVQSLDVFAIQFNDPLEGVLSLAVKLRPAPFRLGGVGPTDVRFPQSCREELLGENEVSPDFWLEEVVLFWGKKGRQLAPGPPHCCMVVAC